MYRAMGQLRLGKLIASLSPSFPFQQGITDQVAQSLPEVLIYVGTPNCGEMKVVTQGQSSSATTLCPIPNNLSLVP